SQHGDAEYLEGARATAPNRRFERWPIGMHREKRRAQPDGGFNALFDRVRNIVKLEVEKDLLSRICKLAHERQAAGIRELIADLIEAYRVAEPRYEAARLLDGRHIERNNQPACIRYLQYEAPSFLPINHKS